MNNKIIIYVSVLLIVCLSIFYYFKKEESVNVLDQTLSIVEEQEMVGTSTKLVSPKIKTKAQSESYVDKSGFYVIQYTNNGFIPKTLQIPKGKSLKFINMSDKGMRIFTSLDSAKFNELNQSETISKGEVYTLSMPNEGLWSFYNQPFPSHSASILVY